MVKKEAALEKPLLDRMRKYEKYCKKEKGREWEIRGLNTFAWGIETAAAVKKHKAREERYYHKPVLCERCKKKYYIVLCRYEHKLCRDCAIDEDFGKVE